MVLENPTKGLTDEEAAAKYAQEYSTHGIIDVHALTLRYQKLIDRVLTSQSARMKVIAAVVIFSLFSYILVPLGFIENEFFPKTDQGQNMLEI